MRLKGKTALIAGAARNMGKAISVTFAREGADLILVAQKRGDELNQVAKQCESLGVQTLPLLADVSNHVEVNKVVERGLERFGKVDVLISVAAIRPHKPVWEFGYDEWHQVFAVNLHSTFFLAKALAPGMIARKSGSIVALGGLACVTTQQDGSAVVASKHGLYGLIKSLALDLGPYGIRANLLAGSRIKSDSFNAEWYPHRAGGHHTPGEEQVIPLRRFGMPQEIANAAVFLASDDSSYVTGDRIICAGGRYM